MKQMPTSIQTEPICWYFTESCKIFTTFATITNDLTDRKWSSIFYRELQNMYCIYHNHRRPYKWNNRWTLQIPMRATVRVLGRLVHLPTDAAISMRACFDTSIPTNFENFGGIFKILVRNSKIYRWNLLTEM